LSYISEFDREAAASFGRNVFDSVERLTDFPESGRIVPEFKDPTIREIIRKPCRIVYRLKKDEALVEIARIWPAARGIPKV
jgi:toxin ParE1/3/4